jgi:hypothetical protein
MSTTKQRVGSGHLIRASLLGSMAIALAGTAAGSDKFPRLGIISTGGPQKYASSFQTFAAKQNVVIIGGS